MKNSFSTLEKYSTTMRNSILCPHLIKFKNKHFQIKFITFFLKRTPYSKPVLYNNFSNTVLCDSLCFLKSLSVTSCVTKEFPHVT